jgi:spore maturation protein CgeB
LRLVVNPIEDANQPCSMKIVFVGDLACPSASGRQRLWALQQCGAQVEVFQKENYGKKFGRLRGILAKCFKNPAINGRRKALGTDLIKLVESFQPDLVWMEWPKEFEVSVFERLRGLPNAPYLLSFQDDNPWGDRVSDQWMWGNYFKAIPYFDLHMIKRPQDEVNLKSAGCKILQNLGAWSLPAAFLSAPNPMLLKRYPVSFVGTCMDGRDQLIGHLLERGVPIHVFGTHWEKRSKLPAQYPSNFHGAVRAQSYAEVIRQSSICLGLVSHSNHDEWTMRSFEVPACGSLLLAERTPTHEAWFREKKEAWFFRTPEQCADLALELLADRELCYTIGETASQKVLKPDWALNVRMKRLLAELGFMKSADIDCRSGQVLK